MAQIDLKDATVTIRDGDDPANTLEVRIGEGNLTFTEARNIDYTLNRGILDEVREGDQIPMAVTFDFVWEYVRGPSSASGSGGTPTIVDALKQIGGAADWVSSDTDTCRPYSIDLVVLYVPNCATGDQEELILADYRYEQLAYDLSAGTIASSGNCNVTEAVVTRSAQS